MKYIVRKVIKGKSYYYLQFKNHSKNLGAFLPENIKEPLWDFFTTLAGKEAKNLSAEVKQAFTYGDLGELERLHYIHVALHHELFKREHDQFYDEFIRLFTYNSNRTEGSRVTRKEIDRFANLKIQTPKTKTDREIYNSFLAFHHATSDEMRWNMKGVKYIHALLLDGLDPMIAGKWKNENNVAPGEEPTCDYSRVKASVQRLIAWLKNEFKKGSYPPDIALKFYCYFEQIHPFLDGNGRVGRILLNAILHKFDYPPVVFFSENSREHFESIKQALNGRWHKMRKHFLNQSRKTSDQIIDKLIKDT